MNCFVTGATGFIGDALCGRLRQDGHQVQALSLRGADLSDGSQSRALDLCQPIPADLLNSTDTIFHLAGIAHQQAERGDYEALNVGATLRLAHLAIESGVRHMVFLSSVKAMGLPTDGAPRAEGDCHPPSDPYGLSKWQAEVALRELCASHDMALTIIRPALVYGPRVKGNLELMARGVRRGLPRPPQGGQRSVIALDDLVSLLCCLANNPPGGIHTWIASGEAYSTREIYDALRSAAGKGAGVGWAPRWAWWMGSALLNILSGSGGEGIYHKLFAPELYDNGAVIEAIDWRPRGNLPRSAAGMLEGA